MASPAAPASRPAGAGEYTAVALLTTGAFVLPIVGPVAGMLLATGSARWTAQQKAVAWTLAAGSAGCGLLLLMVATISSGGPLQMVVAYLVTVAGSAAAGFSLLPGLSTRK